MERVMTSATLVGRILGMLDEGTVEGLMRMRRDPDGSVCWPTIRTINWAWRVAFDTCAPKTIGLETYWLYASPLQAPIARLPPEACPGPLDPGSGDDEMDVDAGGEPGAGVACVFGHSVSCMHSVRVLELWQDEPEYSDFLEFCSPPQFAPVTGLRVRGCLRSLVSDRPGIGNILFHISMRGGPSGATGGGRGASSDAAATTSHPPPCSDMDDPDGRECPACSRLSLARPPWEVSCSPPPRPPNPCA